METATGNPELGFSLRFGHSPISKRQLLKDNVKLQLLKVCFDFEFFLNHTDRINLKLRNERGKRRLWPAGISIDQMFEPGGKTIVKNKPTS